MFSYLSFRATSVAVAVPVSNIHPLITALLVHLTVGQDHIDRRLMLGMAFICCGVALVTIGSSLKEQPLTSDDIKPFPFILEDSR